MEKRVGQPATEVMGVKTSMNDVSGELLSQASL